MRNLSLLTISVFVTLGILTLASCSDDDGGGGDSCATSNLSLDVSASSSFQIMVEGLGGTVPYEFSIDGTTFQGSGEFDVDADEESYTVTVRDGVGCTSTATVSQATLLSFTDARDGQEYDAVKINGVIWMQENLNFETEEGSSCYQEEEVNCNEFGRLYTVAQASSEKLCSDNWRLPTKTEWDEMVDFLGGKEVAGAKLKVGGESGFEAKASGALNASEEYFGEGSFTGFFFSSKDVDQNLEGIEFNFDNNLLLDSPSSTDDKVRFCARCIKAD